MKIENENAEQLQKALQAATSRAVEALVDILGCDINLELNQIHFLEQEHLKEFITDTFGETGTVIQIRFSGGLDGSANLLFPGNNKNAMLEILAKQDPDLISNTAAQTSVIIEVANIVLNMFTGTILNQMGVNVVYEIPNLISDNSNINVLIESGNASSGKQKIHILTSHLSICGQEVAFYIFVKFNSLYN